MLGHGFGRHVVFHPGGFQRTTGIVGVAHHAFPPIFWQLAKMRLAVSWPLYRLGMGCTFPFNNKAGARETSFKRCPDFKLKRTINRASGTRPNCRTVIKNRSLKMSMSLIGTLFLFLASMRRASITLGISTPLGHLA